ncbi:hypothetical protein EJ08DRAFT_238254 [Tothia fuscella]|uniref:DUF7703 domain-containing protein n=1 Tax=Tothia fuscella TaxID=1048955 RepID=A0A9P4TZ61_9PEZI|nr:hypothetical protein EJ08DRAFT_238254 [Tothia fuscella]
MANSTTYEQMNFLKRIKWTSARNDSAVGNFGLNMLVGGFMALAMWSSISLTIRLLFTFKRYRGLYFWSILVTTWALCLRATIFLVKYVRPRKSLLVMAFYELGWIGMVSGFSTVLYSRLRLLVRSRRTRHLTLAMIIIDGVCLHTSTIVVVLGFELRPSWTATSLVLERVHIVCFAIQEAILSGLCTKAAWDQLQAPFCPNSNTKKIMRLIIAVQLSVVLIDVIVVVFDCAGFFVIKAIIYAFTYALKLELEFVALNQLVAISRLGQNELTGMLNLEPQETIASQTAPTLSTLPMTVLDQKGPCALQQQNLSKLACSGDGSGPKPPSKGEYDIV